MTPRLRQAIEMLQMTNLDLAAFVEAQMADNPFLEAPEDAPSAPEPSGDFDPGSQRAGPGGRDGPGRTLEERLTERPSLREHLMGQLNLAVAPGARRAIGAFLIDQLDAAGYITAAPAALAAQIGCEEAEIAELLTTIRGFDPTGIGAGGLAGCLAAQLSEKGQLDAPMAALLDNIEALGRHDHGLLRRVCGVDGPGLQALLARVRACSPRPAGGFDHAPAATAIPDVLMRALPNTVGGGWSVELNAATLPRVLIDRTYYAEVAGAAKRDKRAMAYVRERMEGASWLVKALDQRARTILAVAGAIVERQSGFFVYGAAYLRPMTLKDVAGDIEMHESTVSRVCADKYIGTPRGLLPLKYFFSSALEGRGGAAAHAGEAVRARIKALVAAEDPAAPLSDDKIVGILTGQGVAIARRTVTKYRKALRIPSSMDRRRAALAARAA